jgi:hypothetical protein
LYYVELETHDLLLANGVLAESYCDDGNRWLFQNPTGDGASHRSRSAKDLTAGRKSNAPRYGILPRLAGIKPGPQHSRLSCRIARSGRRACG